MLLMHSGFSSEKQKAMKHRVKKAYKKSTKKKDAELNEPPESAVHGIAFEEVQEFFNFINHINDVATALSFYTLAGASIDKVAPPLNILFLIV